MEFLKQLLLKFFNKTYYPNTGLIETKLEDRDARDLVYDPDATEILGFAKKTNFPNHDCSMFCSTGELQNVGRDKMSCVTGGHTHTIENSLNYFVSIVKDGTADEEVQEIVKIFTYFGIIKDGKANSSIRHIAKLSGTTERGNSQKAVADAIRKYGLVAEEDWPYVSDWDEYYKPVSAEVIEKGKKLAEFIDISYEWVSPLYFYDAVQYGGISTNGYSWNGKKNGLFVAVNYAKNHEFEYVGGTASVKHKIFDTYLEALSFFKELAWDYNFGYGMIFYINLKKKFTPFNEKIIAELKAKGVQYVIRPDAHGEFYRLEDYSLTYISDKTEIETEMKEVFKRDLNTDLLELTKEGKIKWLTENEYKKLLI